MLPDEPNDEEQLEEEPEDNDTPFRPADDLDEAVIDPDAGEEWSTVSEESSITNSERGRVDDTRPETDTGVQLEELYDSGIEGATGARNPNAGDTVIGYRGAGEELPESDNDVPDGFHEEDESQEKAA